MDRLPGALIDTITSQDGLFTRAQAAAHQVSPAAVRWGLHRRWELVLPGVIHVVRDPLTRRQRMQAALLYAGRDAVISGATAAAWWGLEHAHDHGLVRVIVPAHHAARTVRWVSIARTHVPFSAFEDGALRFASPERAIVEAMRDAAGYERAEALALESVNRRLATVDSLAAMNDRLARNGRALADRAIASAASGAWSVPEASLFRLVSRSTHLPELWCNPDLYGADGHRLITPDGWFDDVALALMVHSRRYHAGAKWAGTVERDGELVANGVRVLPLAPASIATEPQRVLRVIEQTYRSAVRMGGRAPVRAVRWAA